MDEATGELTERQLDHESGEAQAFYRDLQGPVRVGLEATGPIHWFERLFAMEKELGLAREYHWFRGRRIIHATTEKTIKISNGSSQPPPASRICPTLPLSDGCIESHDHNEGR